MVKKVNISLQNHILDKIDYLKMRYKCSRGEVISKILCDYLERCNDDKC